MLLGQQPLQPPLLLPVCESGDTASPRQGAFPGPARPRRALLGSPSPQGRAVPKDKALLSKGQEEPAFLRGTPSGPCSVAEPCSMATPHRLIFLMTLWQSESS